MNGMIKRMYVIHVPPATFKKIRPVERRLSKLGINFGRVARKAAGPDPWQIAEHVWLSVQIGKAAIGAYPKIREFLINAGLLKNEILSLGLSKALKPKQKRIRKKTIKA